MPVLDVARPRQQRSAKACSMRAVCVADDQTPLGQPVDDGASHEGETEHGAELQRSDEAELEGGVGQLQDQPGLGDALHPGPDERDQLAGDEQPEVPMVERAQTGRKPHRWVSLSMAAWFGASGRGRTPRGSILCQAADVTSAHACPRTTRDESACAAGAESVYTGPYADPSPEQSPGAAGRYLGRDPGGPACLAAPSRGRGRPKHRARRAGSRSGWPADSVWRPTSSSLFRLRSSGGSSARLLPGVPERSPFAAEVLTWRVLSHLAEAAGRPGFESLADYLRAGTTCADTNWQSASRSCSTSTWCTGRTGSSPGSTARHSTGKPRLWRRMTGGQADPAPGPAGAGVQRSHAGRGRRRVGICLPDQPVRAHLPPARAPRPLRGHRPGAGRASLPAQSLPGVLGRDPGRRRNRAERGHPGSGGAPARDRQQPAGLLGEAGTGPLRSAPGSGGGGGCRRSTTPARASCSTRVQSDILHLRNRGEGDRRAHGDRARPTDRSRCTPATAPRERSRCCTTSSWPSSSPRRSSRRPTWW